jgi:ABC-type oligopeptide transport system substrate-binding subunit
MKTYPRQKDFVTVDNQQQEHIVRFDSIEQILDAAESVDMLTARMKAEIFYVRERRQFFEMARKVLFASYSDATDLAEHKSRAAEIRAMFASGAYRRKKYDYKIAKITAKEIWAARRYAQDCAILVPRMCAATAWLDEWKAEQKKGRQVHAEPYDHTTAGIDNEYNAVDV